MLTLPMKFAETLKKCGDRDALTFVGEEAKTYKQLDADIKAVIAQLESQGIQPGDRVALLSQNMPNWGVIYYAVTFMGAVVVPMLPDFSAAEIKNVLEHSESKLLYVSEGLRNKVSELKIDSLNEVISVEDFTGITSEIKYNPKQQPKGTYYVNEDDLAAIIYTSGTTGRSKGVMLSHKNIVSNAIAGGIVQEVDCNDRFLSILPLSHTYENTLGLILPMLNGSCVYYLKKAPTPQVLLPALKKVKPTLVLSVPLIIEKIYRNKVLPTFQKSSLMRLVYAIPAFRKLLNRVAGKKLMDTFGGELKFFGIGGSKLDKYVEKFLREARFPYAIGYGLTETAPLLAGANPKNTRLQSTGPVVNQTVIRINEPDTVTGEGEIWAKGPSVMKGYYKEPELTNEVITEDGWFKTGDLGVFDKNNNLYIRGRLKNMIIGSNGENIYPEEIETVINNFSYVLESIVVEEKGKLVAMVHFNKEELEKKYQDFKEEVTHVIDKKTDELAEELRVYVNSQVARYARVQRVVAYPTPFTKTATHKIKRYLYKK